LASLRLLVIAKSKGIITDIESRINKLKESGFWIQEDVCNSILKYSGEL
jgi:predicted nucleic acid-binding protein